jgi:DNA gyrase inhibitor GyrI
LERPENIDFIIITAERIQCAKSFVATLMMMKSMFLGLSNHTSGWFGVYMNHIDTTKPSGGLKIRFESSTMVLRKVTTFGVAVGATVFAVAVEIEDRPQRQKYLS